MRPDCMPSSATWVGNRPLRCGALDQLAAGIIITDGDGRVVEMNRAAEHVLRRNDGLTVQQGKLCAQRVFDHEKLTRFITIAAHGKTAAAVGRMLVGRRGGRVPYILTVAPPAAGGSRRPSICLGLK